MYCSTGGERPLPCGGIFSRGRERAVDGEMPLEKIGQYIQERSNQVQKGRTRRSRLQGKGERAAKASPRKKRKVEKRRGPRYGEEEKSKNDRGERETGSIRRKVQGRVLLSKKEECHFSTKKELWLAQRSKGRAGGRVAFQGGEKVFLRKQVVDRKRGARWAEKKSRRAPGFVGEKLSVGDRHGKGGKTSTISNEKERHASHQAEGGGGKKKGTFIEAAKKKQGHPPSGKVKRKGKEGKQADDCQGSRASPVIDAQTQK